MFAAMPCRSQLLHFHIASHVIYLIQAEDLGEPGPRIPHVAGYTHTQTAAVTHRKRIPSIYTDEYDDYWRINKSHAVARKPACGMQRLYPMTLRLLFAFTVIYGFDIDEIIAI